MVKLERRNADPPLTPKPENRWDQRAVFNAVAVEKDGKVHLLYRAADSVPAIATCPLGEILDWARGKP